MSLNLFGFLGKKANKKTTKKNPLKTNKTPLPPKPNQDKRGRTDVNAGRFTRNLTVTFVTCSNHHRFYLANKQHSPPPK